MTQHFYSQHGEDFLLNEIFKNKQNGFFVEVGCIDGRRFSNSLTFEEKGWKGLCVEAHNDYIDLLKKNRPHSIICHCAASDHDEDNVTFYANKRGSLSTLDKTMENTFKDKYGEYFSGFDEQTVNIRRLDTLFKENNVTNIDFMSLDIEGHELEALKGLNFNKYKPTVIVVESDSQKHEQALDNLLLNNGYCKGTRLNQNIFYITDQSLSNNIANKQFNVELIHTRHPVDKGEDAYYKSTINTIEQPENLIPKLLRKLRLHK